MEYTLYILLLPVLSFLVLALAGMKMSHRTAGLIGTASLTITAILAWTAALGYFSSARVDGILPELTTFNISWFSSGSPVSSHADCSHDCFPYGSHLFIWLYER